MIERRTIFLQELAQVSDFLQVQRNMLRSLGVMVFSLLGGKTAVVTLPKTSTPPQITDALPDVSGLDVTVPPLAIYELGTADDAWSILGSDSLPLLAIGANFAGTVFNITPPGANSQYFLIQAKISAITDQNAVVLPYYPIVTTTTASGSSATVLKVASTAGVTAGDRIIVQDFTTTNGEPAVVLSTSGGDTINLNTGVNQFTASPTANKTVRIYPLSNAPFAGQNNNGIAQNIDRVRKVTLQLKAGTIAASPVLPSPDAGFIPLYSIGPVPAGAGGVGGLVSKAPNAPFWPGLVERNHHGGVPGQSNKILVDSELSEDLVKVAGDTMTGDLIVPEVHLSDGMLNFQNGVPSAPTSGHTNTTFPLPTGFSRMPAGSPLGIVHSLLFKPSDPLGTLAWLNPEAARLIQSAVPYARYRLGQYDGNGVLGRTIDLDFNPHILFLFKTTDNDDQFDESSYLFLRVTRYEILIKPGTGGINNSIRLNYLGAIAPSNEVYPQIFNYGFKVGEVFILGLGPLGNQPNAGYAYIALG